MKKRLAVTLAAVALSVVMSVPAYAGTWKYVNDQWKYQRGANKFAYKEWIEDNGNWYYMDNNGVMTTGWQQIDGQWYYMDQAGVMQKGWFKDNDKWYFLLPNGAMATNTVIDGRQIGADGVWIAAEGEVEPANITDLSTPYLVQNLLDGLSTKGYNIITSGKTSTGERWNNAIRLKGKVTVYGDNDTVLYTSQDIHYNEKLMHFGVDVTGQNEIRVEVSLVTDNEWDDPIILIDSLSLYK